jgi:hypothetical protein
MSELKTIGNKLFKTELGTHKIDLALTDDFDKLFKEAIGLKNQYDGNAEKLIQAVQTAKFSVQNYRDKLADSYKLFLNLKTKAKELGLELPKEILAKEDIISKEIKLAVNFNSILMKMQQDIPLF